MKKTRIFLAALETIWKPAGKLGRFHGCPSLWFLGLKNGGTKTGSGANLVSVSEPFPPTVSILLTQRCTKSAQDLEKYVFEQIKYKTVRKHIPSAGRYWKITGIFLVYEYWTFEKPNILISAGFYLINPGSISVLFMSLFDVCHVSFFSFYYDKIFCNISVVIFKVQNRSGCFLPKFKNSKQFSNYTVIFCTLTLHYIYIYCTLRFCAPFIKDSV
jgi:hypothetical protein